jgi:hypothetical protein
MPQDTPAGDPLDVISSILRAVVVQLSSAMQAVERSVNEIDEAFHSIAEPRVESALPGGADFERERDRIVRALQFHDLLEQRVGHACRSLTEVSQLLASHDAQLELEHWQALAASLRSACAIEGDKMSFGDIEFTPDGEDPSGPSGPASPGGGIQMFR